VFAGTFVCAIGFAAMWCGDGDARCCCCKAVTARRIVLVVGNVLVLAALAQMLMFGLARSRYDVVVVVVLFLACGYGLVRGALAGGDVTGMYARRFCRPVAIAPVLAALVLFVVLCKQQEPGSLCKQQEQESAHLVSVHAPQHTRQVTLHLASLVVHRVLALPAPDEVVKQHAAAGVRSLRRARIVVKQLWDHDRISQPIFGVTSPELTRGEEIPARTPQATLLLQQSRIFYILATAAACPAAALPAAPPAPHPAAWRRPPRTLATPPAASLLSASAPSAGTPLPRPPRAQAHPPRARRPEAAKSAAAAAATAGSSRQQQTANENEDADAHVVFWLTRCVRW